MLLLGAMVAGTMVFSACGTAQAGHYDYCGPTYGYSYAPYPAYTQTYVYQPYPVYQPYGYVRPYYHGHYHHHHHGHHGHYHGHGHRGGFGLHVGGSNFHFGLHGR
jgi:hypothetical protein